MDARPGNGREGLFDRPVEYVQSCKGFSTTAAFRSSDAYAPARPPLLSFTCGLGGREVTVPNVREMTDLVRRAAAGEKLETTYWIGIRQ